MAMSKPVSSVYKIVCVQRTCHSSWASEISSTEILMLYFMLFLPVFHLIKIIILIIFEKASKLIVFNGNPGNICREQRN